jgi:MYXO-CTERM domain-containing protein
MRHHLRTASLAAAASLLLAASPWVQASAFTLDFEGLPTGTVVNPQPIGTAYQVSAGIVSTNVGAHTVVNGQFFAVPPPAPGNQFVLSTTQFELDVLNPAAFSYDTLSVSYLGPLEVIIKDTLGRSFTALFDSLAGDDKWLTMPEYKLDHTADYHLIDSITFKFNQVTGIDGFAIDNLKLSLQPVTPPPPTGVPEPAGFGLAALALLGAGLATRRRR